MEEKLKKKKILLEESALLMNDNLPGPYPFE